MNYYLGEFYKYSKHGKKFKLIEKCSFIFKFECGHWCTGNVFTDLIRCKTGIYNFEDTQIKLL